MKELTSFITAVIAPVVVAATVVTVVGVVLLPVLVWLCAGVSLLAPALPVLLCLGGVAYAASKIGF